MRNQGSMYSIGPVLEPMGIHALFMLGVCASESSHFSRISICNRDPERVNICVKTVFEAPGIQS